MARWEDQTWNWRLCPQSGLLWLLLEGAQSWPQPQPWPRTRCGLYRSQELWRGTQWQASQTVARRPGGVTSKVGSSDRTRPKGQADPRGASSGPSSPGRGSDTIRSSQGKFSSLPRVTLGDGQGEHPHTARGKETSKSVQRLGPSARGEVRLASSLSSAALDFRRQRTDTCHTPEENHVEPGILYPAQPGTPYTPHKLSNPENTYSARKYHLGAHFLLF